MDEISLASGGGPMNIPPPPVVIHGGCGGFQVPPPPVTPPGAMSGLAGGKGAGRQAVPGTTVFIFHIPNHWDEAELERHFRHCGRMIQCVLQRKPESGESRGFGFISFERPEGARKAVVAMNGFTTGAGKFLSVSYKKGEEHLALPIEQFPPRGRFDAPVSTSLKGMEVPPGCTIFVFHLPNDWGEEELHRHFIHIGTMATVTVMRNKQTGESRGFGFVSYTHPDMARRAIEGMHGFATPNGKFLKVQLKQGDEGQEAAGGAAWMGLPGGLDPSFGAGGPAPGFISPPPPAITPVHSLPPKIDPNDADVQAMKTFIETGFQDQLRELPPGLGMEQLDQGLTTIAAQAVQSMRQLLGHSPSEFGGDPSLGGQAPRAGAAAVPPGCNVYIFRMPATWSEQDLASMFAPYGGIISVHIPRHQDGSNRGFGFVGYETPEAAQTAIASMNGMMIEGKQLIVQLKEDKRARPY